MGLRAENASLGARPIALGGTFVVLLLLGPTVAGTVSEAAGHRAQTLSVPALLLGLVALGAGLARAAHQRRAPHHG